MSERVRLTPNQRTKLAKRLRHRSEFQPGLTPAQRQDLERHAKNLEQINKIESKLAE